MDAEKVKQASLRIADVLMDCQGGEFDRVCLDLEDMDIFFRHWASCQATLAAQHIIQQGFDQVLEHARLRIAEFESHINYLVAAWSNEVKLRRHTLIDEKQMHLLLFDIDRWYEVAMRNKHAHEGKHTP